MYRSVNPYSEELFFEVSLTPDHKVSVFVQDAYEEFLKFKKTSFKERAEILFLISKSLNNRKRELAQLMTLEMGKPISQSISEIEKCASVCDYYAQHGEEFLKPINYTTSYPESYTLHQPLGIILAIMPWNFPFWQVFRFIAPAIMSGNIGLLKHASNVPQCAQAIEELISECSDRKLLTNLYISNEQTAKLINDHKVGNLC